MMKAKAYYDTVSRGGAVYPRIVKAAKLLQRHAPPSPRFADIGCGTGAGARYIGDVLSARAILGVDVSHVDEARERGVEAYQVDLDQESLPFDDGSLDAIHCGEVIEHLVDTDHLMDEIRRTLAPAGVCALSTPNLASWHNRAALLFGYQPFLTEVSFRHAPGRPGFAQAASGGGHLRVFTYRALLEFLQLHGFGVVAKAGIGVFELGEMPPGSRFAQLVVNPVDKVFTRMTSLACGALVVFRRGA